MTSTLLLNACMWVYTHLLELLDNNSMSSLPRSLVTTTESDSSPIQLEWQVLIFLYLAYFTLQNVFKVDSCCSLRQMSESQSFLRLMSHCMQMQNLFIHSNITYSVGGHLGCFFYQIHNMCVKPCVCRYTTTCQVPDFSCLGHLCLPHYFNYLYGNFFICQGKPVFQPSRCVSESCH